MRMTIPDMLDFICECSIGVQMISPNYMSFRVWASSVCVCGSVFLRQSYRFLHQSSRLPNEKVPESPINKVHESQVFDV